MSQILAVIGNITTTAPIPGADRIQSATVNCGSSGTWQGVIGKDINAGDAVTVFLQDALLPPNSRWAFMEKHNWRVRMARFKGAPSECLIIPGALDMPPGTDLTAELGVTKYEKPVSISMQGDAIGAFPDFIPKTDEPNFQTILNINELMKSGDWYVTEKADGTSCTTWVDYNLRGFHGEYHVCSRNYKLREFSHNGRQNIYWQAARKYKLDRLMPGYALQFEIIGPGIQGNPMGLKDLEIRVFSLFHVPQQRYCEYSELLDIARSLNLPLARKIECEHRAYSHDELLKLAEIKYANGKPGEGIVIRANDSSWSFKVLNLLYKD